MLSTSSVYSTFRYDLNLAMFNEILGNLAVQTGEVLYYLLRGSDLIQNSGIFVNISESHGNLIRCYIPIKINAISDPNHENNPIWCEFD